MAAKIVLYYNDLVHEPSEAFLFKDFGQVPYVLSELHRSDLEYWISATNLQQSFKSFRGKRVRQFGKAFPWLPARFDVFKNSRLYQAIGRDRAVTHLIIFPFTPLTDLVVARWARRTRPGLRIILKLDANRQFLDQMAVDWRRYGGRPTRFARQCYHYRELLKMADAIICETDDCEDLLQRGFLGLDLAKKLVKTYSGLSRAWLSSIGVKKTQVQGRERAIIVSGRISSWQKYSSLIFEAGPPPSGWTVEFIGEVDDHLAKTITSYRANDPEFDTHYKFHGKVSDKNAYFDILMKARVLLMNSRGGEGFPNVFAEAHWCDLFIVTADVSGAAEATGNGRWGMIFPKEDASSLRSALHALPERLAKTLEPPALEELRQRFIWENSLDNPVINGLFDPRTLRAGRVQ